MRRILQLFCIPGLLLLAGCSPDSPSLSRYHVAFVDKLDTVVNFTVWCPSEPVFQEASALVERELDRFDLLFDVYNPASAVSRLNNSAEPVTSPDLAELTEYCRDSQARFGGVNIAMGAAFSLWHGARETGKPPEDAPLREALSHASMDGVHTDGASVRRTDGLLTLDFGAVAKGYAAKKIAAALKKSGITVFLLDCGTSTLVCSGKPPDKNGWQVALRNPDASLNLSGAADPAETLGTLPLRDVCVGVSGDYQKYFEANGIYYAHILSPSTGRPASFYRMVCVLTADAADADFFSTALFVLPPDEAVRAAADAGVEALWMLADGGTQKTGGFPAFA